MDTQIQRCENCRNLGTTEPDDGKGMYLIIDKEGLLCEECRIVYSIENPNVHYFRKLYGVQM